MIFDVDPDAVRASIGVERDLGTALRELESILQQVSHRREKHLPVDIEGKFGVNSADRKFTLPSVSLQ